MTFLVDARFIVFKYVFNAIQIIDVQQGLACNSLREFKITQIIQDAEENNYMKHKEQGFVHVYIINSKITR